MTTPRPRRGWRHPSSDEEYDFSIFELLDPQDSSVALECLDWLMKTGRLQVVATLNGGQGYMYTYQEPKGSSRQGYIPGATQGGRMVDAALETARATSKPRVLGICPACLTPVAKEGDDVLALDSEGDPAACGNGRHGFTS